MSNPSVVYVLTRAYNAERTIRRTIESVLNQTYPNIRYFLRDNGSTDSTYAICKEYADRDERITLVRNERNFLYETEQEIADYRAELAIRDGEALGDNDFFCNLDADDAYVSDFFERAVNFSRKENLDIVVGGTQMILEKTGKAVGGRIHPIDWTIQNNEFSDFFPVYHWHMRQWWGKLYRSRTLHGVNEYVSQLLRREIKSARPEHLLYGYDTLTVLYLFQQAKKVGVLSGVQHKYYIQEKSTSSRISKNRVASDRILQKATLNFLMQKCGFISERNRLFLLRVYLAATQDTLEIIANHSIADSEQLDALYEVFSCEYMPELFQSDDEEIKKESRTIARTVARWMDRQRRAGFAKAADVLALLLSLLFGSDLRVSSAENWKSLILKMPELTEALLQEDWRTVANCLRKRSKGRRNADIPLWTELELYCADALKTSDDQTFSLLAAIKRRRPISWEALCGEERVVRLARNYPILKPLNADLLLSFSDATACVMRGEYDKALKAFLRTDNVEIRDDEAERYFQFALNLAAMEERADVFVYFTKQRIAFLLDCGRTAEAAEETDAYLKIMPEDEELLALRARLRQTEDS